jgi:hypothetical protein
MTTHPHPTIESSAPYLEAFLQLGRREGLLRSPNGAINETLALHHLFARLPTLAAPFPGELITRSMLAYYLKAPRHLLTLIELYAPELFSRKKPVRILYLGASKHEMFDEGRWFSLAWFLAGHALGNLRITVVGPEIAQDVEAHRPSGQFGGAPDMPPALVAAFGGTLSEAIDEGVVARDFGKHYDLVVMHHPGFIGHWHDWLNDEEWLRLAQTRALPIVGTSFDPADLYLDRLGLVAAGRDVAHACVHSAAHFNPCYVDAEHKIRLWWGGILWSTSPRSRSNRLQGQLASYRSFNAMWHALAALQEATSIEFTWYSVTPMQRCDYDQKVWLADQISLDIQTLELTIAGESRGRIAQAQSIADAASIGERLGMIHSATRLIVDALGA